MRSVSTSLRGSAASRRGRRAFTLVELLVVIAIIGILVALLLPAVQAAREAARRTQCLNNITQLGLACQSYDFHFESLPPGVTDDAPGPVRNEPTGQHVSWIVKILPYMEYNPLYRRFDESAGAYVPINAEVRAAQIPVLECPSDGIEYVNREDTVARSAYVGCHNGTETPIDSDNNGLMFLNSKVRFRDIDDGSSNTILITEALTDPNGLGWVSGTRATLRNASVIEESSYGERRARSEAGGDDEEDQLDPLFVGGFGSCHYGGINVNFADGSSRFLPRNIDPEVLHQLGNRADGEIMKPF